jgi:hypothetical protein
LVPRGKSLETNGSAPHLRDLQRELALRGLQPAGPEAIAQPRRRLRPTLVARPSQPRVELILHGTLDDQAGTEPRELRERLSRVLTDSDREQRVDLLLDLRRRRYGTSHGVGLLHRLAGLEGTYAVALTALSYLQQLGDAALVGRRLLVVVLCGERVRPAPVCPLRGDCGSLAYPS